jgi:hypothetical protein
MSRGARTFRERDVTSAVRAVMRTGAQIGRVEIDKAGKIVVHVGMPAPAVAESTEGRNEWDAVK